MKGWKVTFQGLKIFQGFCPGYLQGLFLFCAFTGIYPYFNIYMGAEIVDRLSRGEGRGIYVWVLAAVYGNCLLEILHGYITRRMDHLDAIAREEEKRFMVSKVQTMDYASVESARVQQLRRDIQEAASMNWRGIWAVAIGVSGLMQSAFSILTAAGLFAGMLAIYIRKGFGPAGILFVLLLSLLMAVDVAALMRYKRKDAELVMDNTRMLADENRVDFMLESYSQGKDVRIYRQDRLIMPLKRRYLLEIHREVFSRYFRKIFRMETVPEAMRYLVEGLAYLFVCVSVLKGILGVGSIVKYVAVIRNMAHAVMGAFGYWSDLAVNVPFLEQYLEFCHYPSVMRDGDLAVPQDVEEVEFCDVSFRYPDSEVYALRHVLFRLEKGGRTAIVGRNGSGKTTLIKLLCRLYDPAEGTILLNGVDIRNYRYDEYVRKFSVVFQDYKLFSFSLLENVALSEEGDRGRAGSCLELAGAGDKLAGLPKGLDTPLYKDFDEDGIEVSGGEAQKIAIARALYQEAAFVLLDEPAAALDPEAEYELYERFRQIAEQKTVVYISHRLSSCRSCDRILVLDQGELVQAGGHDDLAGDSEGVYARLWEAQAQYYR